MGQLGDDIPIGGPELEAFEAGKVACYENDRACPYPDDSPLAEHWRHGWALIADGLDLSALDRHPAEVHGKDWWKQTQPATDLESNAAEYAAGAMAYTQQWPVSDCPHPEGTPEHDAWVSGWFDMSHGLED